MCGSMEGAILLASIARQPSADVVGQHPPMLFSNAIPRRPCVREPLGTLTRFRPPLAAQHEAGAARPAVLCVPLAALNGPPTAA